MIGAVVAAVLAAGAVTPWASPSGVESVARAWEPQGGARCQVVFLPGDEDPAQDRSGLWDGSGAGYASEMRDVANERGCRFTTLRTPDRSSGTWYERGDVNAGFVRDYVAAHPAPGATVFVGYSGGAQLAARYLPGAYQGRMPAGGTVLFGGGGPAGGGKTAAPAGYRVLRVTGVQDTPGNAPDGYGALGDARDGHAEDVAAGARASLVTPDVDHSGVIDYMGPALAAALDNSPPTRGGASEGETDMFATTLLAGGMLLGGGGATEPGPSSPTETKAPAGVTQPDLPGPTETAGTDTPEGDASGPSITAPAETPTGTAPAPAPAETSTPAQGSNPLAQFFPVQPPQTGQQQGQGAWYVPFVFLGGDGLAQWLGGLQGFGQAPQYMAPGQAPGNSATTEPTPAQTAVPAPTADVPAPAATAAPAPAQESTAIPDPASPPPALDSATPPAGASSTDAAEAR